MYTRRDIKWSVILRFAWSYVVLFAVWSTAVVLLHNVLGDAGYKIGIPFTPLGTIGVAVAFYVGFKNNQAYDRNWEARKIWGGIVNVSRSWANQVIGYVTGDEAPETIPPEQIYAARQALIYRHLAWINVLRYQLRQKKAFSPLRKGTSRSFERKDNVEELKALVEGLIPSADVRVCSFANPATQILHQQGKHLRELREDSVMIDYFRQIALMDLLTECYTLQGKCERIKGTPFPRQFAYFSKVFVWIFVTLLPFGLVGELYNFNPDLVWLTVPFSIVISWIFITMELVGDNSEDPFENFINDVPMTALCRTIEIDLRQMLGETDVPEPLAPVDDILM